MSRPALRDRRAADAGMGRLSPPVDEAYAAFTGEARGFVAGLVQRSG